MIAPRTAPLPHAQAFVPPPPLNGGADRCGLLCRRWTSGHRRLMSIGVGPVATVARHGKAGVACRSLGGFAPCRLMHGPGL
jgi:hypothetical protein